MPDEEKRSTMDKGADKANPLVELLIPIAAKHFSALSPSSEELRKAMKENEQLLNTFIQGIRESIVTTKNDKLNEAYDEAASRGFPY
jgi:hypothetical protein